MKKRNINIGLALTMSLGIRVTAYAASEEEGTATTRERLGCGRITSIRGQDYVSDVLKNKLGLSEVKKITNYEHCIYVYPQFQAYNILKKEILKIEMIL